MEAGHAGYRGADGNTSWVNVTPRVLDAALGLTMLETTPVVHSAPVVEAAVTLTEMKTSEVVEASDMAKTPEVIEVSSGSDDEVLEVSKMGHVSEVIEVSSGSEEDL